MVFVMRSRYPARESVKASPVKNALPQTDRGLIGNEVSPSVDADELMEQGHLVEGLFHPWIGVDQPLARESGSAASAPKAQACGHCHPWGSTARSGPGVSPRESPLIHLGQKVFPLCLLVAPRQAGLLGKGHLPGNGGISSILGQPIVQMANSEVPKGAHLRDQFVHKLEPATPTKFFVMLSCVFIAGFVAHELEPGGIARGRSFGRTRARLEPDKKGT